MDSCQLKTFCQTRTFCLDARPIDNVKHLYLTTESWPVIVLGVSTLSPASPSCCKILWAALQRGKEQIEQISARVGSKILAKIVLCHINYHIMIIKIISYLIISHHKYIYIYIYPYLVRHFTHKKYMENVAVVILSSFRVGPCRPVCLGAQVLKSPTCIFVQACRHIAALTLEIWHQNEDIKMYKNDRKL